MGKLLKFSPPDSQVVSRLILLASFAAGTFIYLGIPFVGSFLAAMIWTSCGALGTRVLETLFGPISDRFRLLLLLGPAPLIGAGLLVLAYLMVGGGAVGYGLVVVVLLLNLLTWGCANGKTVRQSQRTDTVVLTTLVGSALIANAREFPNLLLPGIAIVLLLISENVSNRGVFRVATWLLVFAAFTNDVLTRVNYWWWSSDDTTVLSGIGTSIIERGKVEDVAGWSTSSHHWLLHAWLALWNNLSLNHVFETYQVLWPLVAAISLLASLWLGIELLLSRTLSATQFSLVAIAMAGFLKLDWSAPQEQQPFLFALITCCILCVNSRAQKRLHSRLLLVIAVFIGTILLPLGLYLLKPTLLVAYLLLSVGTILIQLKFDRGLGLVVAGLVSAAVVAVGLLVMAVAERFISGNSFTTFAIDFFPGDLGWCQSTSYPGSLACIFSIQVVLLAGGVLSLLSIWQLKPSRPLSVSLALLMPLFVSYLPFRYLISSGVGSGAPSFYRLSEMALMFVVAVGLSVVISLQAPSLRIGLPILLTVILVNWVSQGPSRTYDTVDSLLTSFSISRFLNASDVVALVLLVSTGGFVAILGTFTGWKSRFFVVSFCLVASLPTVRLGTEGWRAEPAVERRTRPEYLGPADIETLGLWIRHNVEPTAKLATNYLCPPDRLAECVRSTPQVACPNRHPVLMSSWALAALSRRDFLYLSQGWSDANNFVLHELSTKLSGDISSDNIRILQSKGVNYYVASREHTSQTVWSLLSSVASFQTEHFVVVSLDRLQARV